MQRLTSWLTISFSLALGAAKAAAQAPDQPAPAPGEPAPPEQPAPRPLPEPAPAPPPEATPAPTAPAAPVEEAEPARRYVAFVEAFGNWGVNFGETEYVPDGPPGDSKHPFATGFGGGATFGYFIASDWLSVIASYRFGHTSTRTGQLDGVLDEVEGSLSYHILSVGLRTEHRLGPGSVYAQLAVGVALPSHTKLTFVYAPQLAAIGITGEGKQEDDFATRYGAEAEMGYHFDLSSHLYLGAGLHVGTFQGSNAGKDTTLTNFVTDFTATPPVAVTTTIHHGTEAPVTPRTEAISDVRLQIALGYRF